MPMYNIPLIIIRDQGPSVSSNYEIVGMYVIRGGIQDGDEHDLVPVLYP